MNWAAARMRKKGFAPAIRDRTQSYVVLVNRGWYGVTEEATQRFRIQRRRIH